MPWGGKMQRWYFRLLKVNSEMRWWLGLLTLPKVAAVVRHLLTLPRYGERLKENEQTLQNRWQGRWGGLRFLTNMGFLANRWFLTNRFLFVTKRWKEFLSKAGWSWCDGGGCEPGSDGEGSGSAQRCHWLPTFDACLSGKVTGRFFRLGIQQLTPCRTKEHGTRRSVTRCQVFDVNQRTDEHQQNLVKETVEELWPCAQKPASVHEVEAASQPANLLLRHSKSWNDGHDSSGRT